VKLATEDFLLRASVDTDALAYINSDPPLENIRNKDGIAMCLLVKDDNEKLPEWLAYHFLEMPLQYLIVGVDPNSTTTPKNILDMWRNETGMEIVLWYDAHYRHVVTKEFEAQIRTGGSANAAHQSLKLRQGRFNTECMRHHKAKGRKWVAIIDTDEFIANNVVFGEQERENYYSSTGSSGKNNEKNKNKLEEYQKNYVLKPNQTLLDYTLKGQPQNNNSKHTTHDDPKFDPFAMESMEDRPCVLIPRLLFTSVEEEQRNVTDANKPFATRTTNANTNTQQPQPSHLDPMRFNTLRFFHHADPESRNMNGVGKVIINLEKISYRDFYSFRNNPHRPLNVCGFPYGDHRNKPLMIHHYVGSWEQYNAKGDGRRSRERFNSKAYISHGKTYHLQGWLKRFVDKMGIKRSRKLLKGAGIIEMANANVMLKYLPDYPKHDDFEERKETYGNSTHPEDLPYFGANGEVIQIPLMKEI